VSNTEDLGLKVYTITQQQEVNLFEYLDKKLMWKTYVNKIITNTNLRSGTYDQELIPG
jgi:hypothetical protein